TTQSSLHIQCNPNKNCTGLLLKARTNNPKICVEPQKTPNSQINVEKKTKWEVSQSQTLASTTKL
ncbi:hypothetical protein, partial [Escherichia coli]|uniref:hypothetical protein n=1 Tax=Escherichia coli TaxID=562 RepID=UPI001BE3DFE8